MASDLSNLSNDVKLFMKRLTAERHYALNDRTINLLMKGNIDMTASTSMKDGGNDAKGSDEDIVDLLEIETNVSDNPKNNRQQSNSAIITWEVVSPFLNRTNKYDFFQISGTCHLSFTMLAMMVVSIKLE